MSLIHKLVKRARRDYAEHGLRAPAVTAGASVGWLYDQLVDNSVTHALARRGSQNVYEREWDVLILLDCARVDMMEAVKDEYEFIDEVGEHVTPGTHSPEWMQYTFTDEHRDEVARTLHVTANTYSAEYIDGDALLHLEEVWRDGWDEEHKTVLPRTVTDRAISLYRELSPERTIIHYMQPHTPFVPFPEIDSRQLSGPGVGESGGMNVPELAEAGYTREEIWQFHIENLRYVLDDLEVLLSSIDADRVVISADHGQALGEKGVWGHPRGSRLKCVRTVPWCVTSAKDTGEYDPPERTGATASDDDELSVEEKLRYLGYRD